MLIYEILTIILKPLVFTINQKFYIPVLILLILIAVSGILLWFVFRRHQKKEVTTLHAASLAQEESMDSIPTLNQVTAFDSDSVSGLENILPLEPISNPDHITPLEPISNPDHITPLTPAQGFVLNPPLSNLPDEDHVISQNIPKHPLIPLDLEALNTDLKPFGFAYYPDQDFFYSIMYGWQSECGYCQAYDEGSATLSMIIDCEPVYFKYGGKKWLIEFWKGQYGMTTGCEIGIYTTTGPSLNIPGVFNGTFYFCAAEEDHMPLSFVLKKNGREIFRRSEHHWWLTAFKLGEYSWPSELTVDIGITLKDTEMRDAFIGGLLKTGYSLEDLTIQDNTVSLVYATPHSKQPSTRTPLIESYMQDNNLRNTTAYNIATRAYTNTVDRLNYVRYAAPKLYHKIINIGSTKEFFKGYDLIRRFLGIREPVRKIDKQNGIFFSVQPEVDYVTVYSEPDLTDALENLASKTIEGSECKDEVNEVKPGRI